MIIVAHFESAIDTPMTSPGDVPTIRVRRTDTQALVVTDATMTEMGDGLYSYDFAAAVDGREYSIRANGDPTAAGQTVAGGRYAYGAASGTEEARLETDIPAVLVDTGTTLPAEHVALAAQNTAIEADTQNLQGRVPAALVGGRMDSDVANMQADTVDANALAADAVNEIADVVLREVVNDHVATAGSLAEAIAVVRGARTAYVLDGGDGQANVTLDAQGLMTSGRIRLFSTPALAGSATLGAADGADGELAAIDLTATAAAAGQLDNMRMVGG